jgi:urocanate hydratase
MNDSRFDQVCALVDDARCLIADITEEGVDRLEDRMYLDGIRHSLNEALRRTKNLKSDIR